MIVNGFWKLRYNRLLIGICALGDIFQAKLDKLLGDIKGVKKVYQLYISLKKGDII